ncbi:transporter substrate-binding domain-containing protein [Clostridium sp. WILCCON 0269]|uniref:Transporter substrate-binding domain-containing protein n=1 Tax=Candidatus Clostridium eludens TaxID=3381663 RepID=A0ABW8SHS9_9CLOT
MKKPKIFMLFLASLLTIFALAGCGAKATSTSSSSAPKTIVIGTGNAFKPYCYLDDKGNLAGYEYEVLKEVDRRLPQYKFEYQTMDFKNVLLSLASKKVDIAAHQFEKNPERIQKYLFSDESYTTFILRITVLKNRTDINSIKDLEGKTVNVSPGSNDAYVLEKYNKQHNNAIKLVYSTPDNATLVKNLEDGRIDAFISIKRIVADLNKTYGDKLKTVGDPIATSNTYYIFRKDDTQLKADIDKTIKAMKADGTLSKISKDVLGGDYTTND